MRLDQILKKSGYQQKLETGEWKAFASRVKKDKPYCECCKRADVLLNVHHVSYDSNREPWQYSLDEVIVLCRQCHQEVHNQLNQFRKYVFGKMRPEVFRVLNGALAVAFDKYDPLVFVHALAEFVSTPTMVDRYARAWNITSAPKSDRPYSPDDAVNRSRTALTEMSKEEVK